MALGLLQSVFLLAAVAPRMVWCHKPDGRMAIELEASPGECHCQQCPLCRERASGVQSEDPGPRSSFHAVHCRHDEIRSEAGRTAGLIRSGGGAVWTVGPVVIPKSPVLSELPASAPALAASSAPMDAGPPDGILRC
jgi:hypothetical protein